MVIFEVGKIMSQISEQGVKNYTNFEFLYVYGRV